MYRRGEGECVSGCLGVGQTVTYFGDIVRSQGIPSWPYVSGERKHWGGDDLVKIL